MNIRRLPYRLQIPLGLAVALVIAALLVTATASRLSARSAREASVATVGRATDLLAAQVRPFLAADDTWRVFALLRNTAVLLPGAAKGTRGRPSWMRRAACSQRPSRGNSLPGSSFSGASAEP